MKLFPTPTAENSEVNIKTRFPRLHLIIALTVTLTAILLFAWEFYETDYIQPAASPTYQYSTFSSVVIMLMPIISLMAWLATIRALNSSRKALLINDKNRKQTEEAARLSETYFRELLDNANDLFYTTDLQGNFTSFNKAGEIITGYTRDEAVSKNIAEIIAPDYLEFARQTTVRKLEGEPQTRYELEILSKDNQRIAIEISSRLIYEANQPIGVQGIGRDVTDRKRAEEELQKNFSLLTSTLEATAEGILVVDLNDKIVTYNKRFVELWRIPDEIINSKDNRKVINFVSNQLSNPDDFANSTKSINASPEIKSFDILEFKDGKVYERYSHPQILDGKINGRVLSFRDITEQRRINAALRESEYTLRTLFASMGEGLTQVNNDEVIEYVNDRLCELTGYERKELLGKTTFEMFFDEEGRAVVERENRQRQKGISMQYETRLRKKSGEMLWVLISGAPIVNAENVVTGTLGVFMDITERKRTEEQMLHDAFHDSLTGLANRALFSDHLRLRIERGKRDQDGLFAVLFLDFDRFKVVNDSLGHAEGDALLILIARRLESSLRSSDVVARLGGDEFTILLSELDEEDDAIYIANRIQENLKVPFDLGGGEIFMSASIGVALSTIGHTKAEDMLRDADIAMYCAKADGKACHKVFDRAMHDHALTQMQLETDMRQGFERGEFCLYYQPIFVIETNNLAGFEALIRWNHPTRGMVSPDQFIPIAEETGLILPLGRWILFESCRQMREWQDKNPAAASLKLSVNLSCKQFSQPDLVEQVTAALISTRLDAHCLKLEITESHLMENSALSVKMMSRLRELGVELSLDDFGTGYSSLSYLHRLPVNYLKIDRSFVSRMTESTENGEIVNTIIKLAQSLKMKVIAEGIETANQLAQLKHLNCEYGQGYFYSKPLAAEDAKLFIDQITTDSSLIISQQIINLELNM
ncbi:hypothetical protein BH20ACI1_BH20ACI1_29930 [soil metagenome]